MPAYVNSPFVKPILLQKGVPAYLWGSFNSHQGNTRAFVSNVALTTNVATVTVQIVSGEIPTVGSQISIIQTQTSSGVFNVNRATITAVSINASTGQGTISFALTNANIASTADTGTVEVEVPEVGEALAAGASIACAIQAPDGDSQFTVPCAVTFPVMPTGATIVLQRAIRDVNSEYTTIGNAAVVAASAFTTGPVSEFTLERGYVYRFLNSGVTGTSPTIVAKIG